MLILKSPKAPLADVIAVGNFVSYKDMFFDIRKTYNEINYYNALEEWQEYGCKDLFRYFVSNNVRDLVNSKGSEYDYATPLDSDNPKVRALVALNGKNLGITVSDEDAEVREKTAISFLELKKAGLNFYSDSLLDGLVNDPSAAVREAVAWNGKADLLDVLVNDTEIAVRKAVAAKGNIAHHTILINDSDSGVRSMMAHVADNSILLKLAHDACSQVRTVVATRLSDDDIEKANLVADEDAEVRKVVAYRGNHYDVLSKDADELVREAAEDAKSGYIPT